MPWKRLSTHPLVLSLSLLALLVWTASLVWGQSPGAAPTCETTASEQYRTLLTDQLVPQPHVGQPLTPPQQVLIIAGQLRM